MTVSLSRRAFLGAQLPGDHEAFTSDGVCIAGVTPGSMAERAGLPVRDLCELSAALRQAGGAAATQLSYLRGAKRRTADVEVVSFPYEPAARYLSLAVGGATLRTIETTPQHPRALIVLVAGIACESVDHDASPVSYTHLTLPTILRV